ncbi:MAG: radical SAM protein [Acetobacteraceae bacterium]|nr:radical SAM protein [Acetobacteraceae bacterium]
MVMVAKPSRYNIEVEADGALFLYNPVSSALLRLDGPTAETYRAIAAGGSPDPGHPLTQELTRGRMLVDDSLNELLAIRTDYLRGRFGHSPNLALTIAPTLDCNLDCVYCFESKRRAYMDRATEDAVLAFVRSRVPPGFKRLDVFWYGGEPLLCIDTMERLSRALISLCSEEGAEYRGHVTTNGSLLDRNAAQLLRELRVEKAQFTIDGGEDTHNSRRPLAGGAPSFEATVENLRHCHPLIPCVVRVNVDKGNTAAALEIFDVVERLGLKNQVAIYFAPVQASTDACRSIHSGCHSPPDFAGIQVQLYRAALARGFYNVGAYPRRRMAACGAIRDDHVLIGPDGTLWKCWETVGEPAEAVGHVARPGEVLPRAYEWSGWDPLDQPECRECRVFPLSDGCCPWRWRRYLAGVSRVRPCVTYRFNIAEILRLYIEKMERTGTVGAPPDRQ